MITCHMNNSCLVHELIVPIMFEQFKTPKTLSVLTHKKSSSSLQQRSLTQEIFCTLSSKKLNINNSMSIEVADN